MSSEWEHVRPEEIESRSFEIIQSELGRELDPEKAPVIMRVIHTTADFTFADTLAFSDGAIEYAIAALKGGASIVTDTNMARAGINKVRLSALGGEAHCFMADPDVAADAKENGTTRAAASMRKAARMEEDFIYAIGNAPTALGELCRQVKEGSISPALIIGVPVGFVNVVESKEDILGLDVPYIVARGRRGGSNVAAAICNALLYMI